MLIDSSNMQPSVNVYPNGGMGGNGGFGDAWGGNGFFWILILFFFAMFGGWGGYGANAGGNAGMGYIPYMNTGNEVQRGFDQSAIMGGLNGIQNAINNGFDMDMKSASELEVSEFGISFSSEDLKEGTSAFLEKRAPEFKNK